MKAKIWGAALLLCASPLFAQGGMGGGSMGGTGGGGSGMGGGGMGGPPGGGPPGDGAPRKPREMKPVKRTALDKPVTAMFTIADADRDGIVTLTELRAVVQARRDVTIRARFKTIDGNRDGAISPDEFLGWQRTMGSVAFSDSGALGDRDGPVADAIQPPLDDDAQDQLLALVIEPLNANSIAQANGNYDAGVSLDELLAYQRKRFDAVDTNQDGYLTGDEVRSLMPRGGPGGGRPAGGPPLPPPGR